MHIKSFFTKNAKILFLPLMFISFFGISHLLFDYYANDVKELLRIRADIQLIENTLYYLLMALCEYWLCMRFLNKGFQYLQKNVFFNKHPILYIVQPFFHALIKTLIFLVLFNFLTENLNLPRGLSYILNKLTSVLIICCISWLVLKLIDIAVQLMLHHFSAESNGDMIKRKVYTQTLILKRVAYSVVSILGIGSVLVLFDNVRALGTSVLTTAGVMGLVLTFTAQKSLASIFSGIEIALTQPIKIGDTVVIDTQVGVVEEINFRHVIIKLLDWRKMVVPTSFFLEKSFQNWSREQDTNLIGIVILYADFTLPIADLRNRLQIILNKSPYWDQNVGKLEVGDLMEQVMQIKISASAQNANDLSSLKAFIREELIKYIVHYHPHALPKTRSFEIGSTAALEKGVLSS